MKKILFLSLVLFLSITFSYTQHNIEIKEGIFYTNYFRSSQNTDSFWGWGNKTEIVYSYDLFSIKRNRFSLGAGYTNFNFLDDRNAFILENTTTESRSYVNLLLRYSRSITKSTSIYTNMITYYMLHPLTEFGLHKKMFLNADLGINLKLSNKLSFIISMPIPITPMYSGVIGFFPLPPSKVTGEQIGLDIGLKYSF